MTAVYALASASAASRACADAASRRGTGSGEMVAPNDRPAALRRWRPNAALAAWGAAGCRRILTSCAFAESGQFLVDRQEPCRIGRRNPRGHATSATMDRARSWGIVRPGPRQRQCHCPGTATAHIEPSDLPTAPEPDPLVNVDAISLRVWVLAVSSLVPDLRLTDHAVESELGRLDDSPLPFDRTSGVPAASTTSPRSANGQAVEVDPVLVVSETANEIGTDVPG